MMTNDAECLQRYAESHDQEAFSAFVHQNLRLVYSAAFRQTGGDAHLAHDVTQIVFIHAAQHARALARHPVVPAWLHQATRNAAIDTLRTRQRRRAREEAACTLSDSIQAAEDHLDWEKISPVLDQLIASLGDRDREAVILRFFGEKSFAEIGQQLQLSENAARMRVDRALDKLRARLLRKGVASTGVALASLLSSQASIAAPPGLAVSIVSASVAAPAASAAALLWGAVQIMSITKITAGIATAVAIVSLATAVHEYRTARSAEDALNEFKTAQQTKTSASPAASPSAANPAEGTLSATASGKPGQAAPQANNPLAAVIAVLSNPAIQEQSSITTRIRLDTQYGALFKKLNLAPDQLEQFKNLVIEKQMVAFDSITAATEQGINPFADTQGFLQVVMGAMKNVDGQIATLLGEGGYKEFSAYETTIPARNTVSILEQALSFTATPLSAAQSERVIEVLTAQGTPGMPANNPFSILNSDLGVIGLSEQGRTQIDGILAPQQARVLVQKIQQQLELLQARGRLAQPARPPEKKATGA